MIASNQLFYTLVLFITYTYTQHLYINVMKLKEKKSYPANLSGNGAFLKYQSNLYSLNSGIFFKLDLTDEGYVHIMKTCTFFIYVLWYQSTVCTLYSVYFVYFTASFLFFFTESFAIFKFVLKSWQAMKYFCTMVFFTVLVRKIFLNLHFFSTYHGSL